MSLPVFLQWTVMPAEIVARAWTDSHFKRELLLWPTQTLQEVGAAVPEAITFCVIENSSEECHLVLPYRHPKTYGWSREKITDILLEETGCDDSLEYWLPVDIMVEAFFNPAFKKSLYADLNTILRDRGYNAIDCKYTLVENTEHSYNLVLPVNKWQNFSLEADDLEILLIEDFLKKHMVH